MLSYFLLTLTQGDLNLTEMIASMRFYEELLIEVILLL
jgi:hypothetical protein